MSINWDDYFMSIAYIASLRSKDPKTKVGACIVNQDNRIISTGYNGMPNGCNDADMPWVAGEGLGSKYLFVVHAELNAILHSKENLKGCRLYTTLFPCNECSKAIIQSGISEIIYLREKNEDTDVFKASRFMLSKGGVEYRKLVSDLSIEVNLGI